MTFNELVPMLGKLYFDCSITPPQRGAITLAEFSYDEVEEAYYFRFRWRDIKLAIPSAELPQSVWDIIAQHASPGETSTFIFGISRPLGWRQSSTTQEIETGLSALLQSFTAEMETITAAVSQWIVQADQ